MKKEEEKFHLINVNGMMMEDGKGTSTKDLEIKFEEIPSDINGKKAVIDALVSSNGKCGSLDYFCEGITEKDIAKSAQSMISKNGHKRAYYRNLNYTINSLIKKGINEIELNNINGQRYIGDGIKGRITLVINGVPGQGLGSFMDGPKITVNSNAQDFVGNTMDEGKIVIHGRAGDTPAYAMRGGKIFVRDDIGYRAGIHMKEYKDKIPVLIAGGKAGDFFGEYMAGGIMVLLGLKNYEIPSIENVRPLRNDDEKIPLAGNYIGTGMHGGVIYIREDIEERQLGEGVAVKYVDDEDALLLEKLLLEYSEEFKIDYNKIIRFDIGKISKNDVEESILNPMAYSLSIPLISEDNNNGTVSNGISIESGLIYLKKALAEDKYNILTKIESLNSIKNNFIKLVPVSHRPYGRLYAV